jgi:predicted helicase
MAGPALPEAMMLKDIPTHQIMPPKMPIKWLRALHRTYEVSREDFNSDIITKEAIFHYVYAVLHNPAYRKKYELNLKREFPRIPSTKTSGNGRNGVRN